MPHPLDRPIWSALTGPQAHLARGDPAAWRIDPAIGHFAAAATTLPEQMRALAGLRLDEEPLILFEAASVSPPRADLTVVADMMVQMTAAAIDPPPPGPRIVPLGERDAAAMLALATLTRPGPFLASTHRLGGFVGIRHAGDLVAMAGTRLRVDGHVEISAVCTHPDHRGQGHAARLMQAVATGILADGNAAFLHAYARNSGAIALYERLGFRIRRHLVASMIVPAASQERGR